MRAPTEAEVLAAIGNLEPDERAEVTLPADFILVDWDYRDFFTWLDPKIARRGYVIVDDGDELRGIAVHMSGPGRVRSGMCNICHTMQPGNQVGLCTARRGGAAGRRGDSVGTYVCADMSCHDNVRLAHPLAPNEVRAPGQVDLRLDGTRRRMEAFVARVLEPVG